MRRLPLLRSTTAALLWIAGLTAQAATITVNSTADVAADDGQCTLREAIVAANTNTASGGAAGECVAGNAFPTIDTIAFAIAGSGVHTITPTTVMPDIGEPLVIDGYTQPGASVNTLAVGNNAVLQIELNGSALPFAGLFRLGDGSTIRG
jgi:CSLREA domain-containing protein